MKNMRRENKLYSYKDQLMEMEIRKVQSYHVVDKADMQPGVV